MNGLGSLRRLLTARLTPAHKRAIRARIARARGVWASLVRAHGSEELEAGLRRVGVDSGDVLLVHAGWNPFSGFQGSARDVVDVLLRVVGSEGTLMMVSLPYTGATSAYLREDAVFDVRRTPSRMGLLTEVFRRREGVLRSLSPSHPILAMGPDAEGLLSGHERCAYPCGPGSPFEKLLHREGKILFLDAPLDTMTYLHYLEHVASARLPFPLYAPEPVAARVLEAQGREHEVLVYPFSGPAVRRRDPAMLLAALEAEGVVRRARVGGTSLRLVSCVDALKVATGLMERRASFVFAEADLPGREA